MRIAVIGANGQLGHDLLATLPGPPASLNWPEVDVTSAESVAAALADSRPEVIVNCAAATNVDACETDVAAAFAVNATGALHVARAAAEIDARVVYISTDYVFGGGDAPPTPLVERDRPAPVNVYGASKLAGEALTAAYAPRHLIVRTSGLYGHAGALGKGGNFVETILQLARQEAPLRVVADQVLSPTSTAALAGALGRLIASDARGLRHVVARDHCSWREFAAAIVQIAGIEREVAPIPTSAFPRPAPRPRFCAMTSSEADTANALPTWREMLAEYIRTRPDRDAATQAR